MKSKLEKIALERLGLETLETQRIGAQDFCEHAVWSIKAALEAAYVAGALDGAAGLRELARFEARALAEEEARNTQSDFSPKDVRAEGPAPAPGQRGTMEETS